MNENVSVAKTTTTITWIFFSFSTGVAYGWMDGVAKIGFYLEPCFHGNMGKFDCSCLSINKSTNIQMKMFICVGAFHHCCFLSFFLNYFRFLIEREIWWMIRTILRTLNAPFVPVTCDKNNAFFKNVVWISSSITVGIVDLFVIFGDSALRNDPKHVVPQCTKATDIFFFFSFFSWVLMPRVFNEMNFPQTWVLQ